MNFLLGGGGGTAGFARGDLSQSSNESTRQDTALVVLVALLRREKVPYSFCQHQLETRVLFSGLTLKVGFRMWWDDVRWHKNAGGFSRSPGACQVKMSK